MNDASKNKIIIKKEIPLEFESIEDLNFSDSLDLKHLGIDSIFPQEFNDFEEVE